MSAPQVGSIPSGFIEAEYEGLKKTCNDCLELEDRVQKYSDLILNSLQASINRQLKESGFYKKLKESISGVKSVVVKSPETKLHHLSKMFEGKISSKGGCLTYHWTAYFEYMPIDVKRKLSKAPVIQNALQYWASEKLIKIKSTLLSIIEDATKDDTLEDRALSSKDLLETCFYLEEVCKDDTGQINYLRVTDEFTKFLNVSFKDTLGEISTGNIFYKIYDVLDVHTKKVEDNLLKIWNKLRMDGVGVPELETGKEVRKCFLNDHNRAALDGVTTLNLEDLELDFLPASELRAFLNLKNIFLSENKLKTIPPGCFVGSVFLEELELNNNKIELLPAGCFLGLSKLKNLDLNDNLLTKIPYQCFLDLRSLRNLFLMRNSIKELESRCFEGLENLWSLSLSDNKLLIIPKETFSGCCKLEVLHIDSNKIKVLPESCFKGLESVKAIYLAGNPVEMVQDGWSLGIERLGSLSINSGLRELFPLEHLYNCNII
jgi:Leucine-rich repeat (LRR) protein